MFKIGDLVECCIKIEVYNITDVGVICEVTSTNPSLNKIKLKPIEIKKSYKGENRIYIEASIKDGSDYWVEQEFFKEVKTKKTNRR